MKVKFSSGIISQNLEEKIVNFIAPVFISKQEINGLKIDVFETTNPENDTHIRLEIFQNSLIIFVGENTLFFELNKEIANKFYNQNGETNITSLLWYFEVGSDKIDIKYDLFLDKTSKALSTKIATYHTFLEFFND